MSNPSLLSQFPKPIIPYLLDLTPKLKVNWIDYDLHNNAKINCHIMYSDHKLPLQFQSIITSNKSDYNILCAIIDQIVDAIINGNNLDKKSLEIPIEPTFLGEGDVIIGKFTPKRPENEISINNGITIGNYTYPFSCKEPIISLLKLTKEIGFPNFDTQYITDLYQIYIKQYPTHMNTNNLMYLQKENTNLLQQYGFKKFTHIEYEELCKQGGLSDFFPLYYCNKKDCPLKIFTKVPNQDKLIVMLYWRDKTMEYLFMKK